jgi:hypothetical protein
MPMLVPLALWLCRGACLALAYPNSGRTALATLACSIHSPGRSTWFRSRGVGAPSDLCTGGVSRIYPIVYLSNEQQLLPNHRSPSFYAVSVRARLTTQTVPFATSCGSVRLTYRPSELLIWPNRRAWFGVAAVQSCVSLHTLYLVPHLVGHLPGKFVLPFEGRDVIFGGRNALYSCSS